ncbi:Lrp/AsnC family transcriptional regulator [Mucilaginibacter gotjawali]|uniref:Lrp/AsnC family leucine-responsive transcriptional regulator n=2 Tax=Mucilaginibacter gotjawali TaxID=1550579 RepID=A0A839SB54_9SPHI|nr:Lrp/AsnC family transcriptional regulator [Mucilaginibacter gotjawali]MBB3053817.1 Lrp/AsnC family leucine-responsive transcriptional regulator [Mucilaginibacter gotjawali]BAU54080.1 Leucine-responsive regulatory protein [Mucilaginibacter gotjawali]
MKKKLDKFDIGILNALQNDCRTSCRKIGTQIGLSETPVQLRIQHMVEDGYIKRFTAILDAKKVGYGLIGYVQAKLGEHTEECLTSFMSEAIKLGEVKECYHMSGAYDFLLRVAINDMAEYSSILMKKLARLPGKPHFETFFVMSEGKCETRFDVR